MSEPNRFTEFFVHEVRQRTRIVDLIGKDVALKGRGHTHWGLCPFHQEKTASFTVREDRGRYRCFGCGAKGDVIEYLVQAHGMTFCDAVQELAVAAGLATDAEGRQRPRKPVVKRPSESDAEQERLRMIAWARDLWRSCHPAGGTPAEAYLRSRGITLPVPPTLRYHPGLKHKGTGLLFPAMVAAVQDGDGIVTGIHRTFLLPDGRGKARVSQPKQMGGACWGGCVRLGPVGSHLDLAEGIETALWVQQSTGRSCWAALSLGGMGAAVLPPEVRSVTLCGENGNKDPEAYRSAFEGAMRWHGRHGREVASAFPPPDYGDFDDLGRGVKLPCPSDSHSAAGGNGESDLSQERAPS